MRAFEAIAGSRIRLGGEAQLGPSSDQFEELDVERARIPQFAAQTRQNVRRRAGFEPVKRGRRLRR